MPEATRTSVEEARRKQQSGEAMLVCAYEDDEKYRKNNLEGSISIKELEAKLDGISKDREIIFYCA